MAYICRILHLVSAMLLCCMVMINGIFDRVTKDIKVFNSKDFPKYVNQAGIVMNVSGFALVYFMRATQKANKPQYKKAQSEWLQLMPRKLLLSLTLTPLTDRFVMGIFNVKGVSGDDIFQEDINQLQRLEAVESLISFFKMCMVVGIYCYSAYQKSFRESQNNFRDDEEGLGKIIDSMIKKI